MNGSFLAEQGSLTNEEGRLLASCIATDVFAKPFAHWARRHLQGRFEDLSLHDYAYEGRFTITWIMLIVLLTVIQSDSSRLQITALLPLFQILYDSPICHKK